MSRWLTRSREEELAVVVWWSLRDLLQVERRCCSWWPCAEARCRGCECLLAVVRNAEKMEVWWFCSGGVKLLPWLSETVARMEEDDGGARSVNEEDDGEKMEVLRRGGDGG